MWVVSCLIQWFACSSIFSLSPQAQAGQTVEMLQIQVKKSSHN